MPNVSHPLVAAWISGLPSSISSSWSCQACQRPVQPSFREGTHAGFDLALNLIQAKFSPPTKLRLADESVSADGNGSLGRPAGTGRTSASSFDRSKNSRGYGAVQYPETMDMIIDLP